jgi:hypothetical protein
MRVKSAVDWWLGLILWLVIISLIGTSFIVPPAERLFVYLINIPVLLLTLWIYFGTYYELREDLFCRSGPFFTRIPYETITSVRLSRNPLSSLALSLNRIEIAYTSKGIFSAGLVYISPPDREAFIKELLTRCPHLANGS